MCQFSAASMTEKKYCKENIFIKFCMVNFDYSSIEVQFSYLWLKTRYSFIKEDVTTLIFVYPSLVKFFGIEVVMYPNPQLVRSSEDRCYQKRDRPKGCQREGPVWRWGGGRVEGLGRRPHSQGVRHDVGDDGLLVVSDQEVRPGSSSPHAHVLSVVRLTL